MTFNYQEIGRILSHSFRSAFKWSVWKWLLGTSFTAITGFTLFGEKFLGLSTKTSIIVAASILLSLFIIRFFLIFIKESIKYFHEVYINSAYGEAIILLNESFSYMHNYRKTPGHNDEEFMTAMLLLCKNLKSIFEKLLKSNCSVSIKVPLAEDTIKPQTLVANLVRDIENKGRDTLEYRSTKHTLVGNTAFSYCLNRVSTNSEDRFYRNNKVNKTENYENTSKICYNNGLLPYNSELVVPISTIKRDSTDCLGFICIDTNKEEAFNLKSKYEVAILEGVADGIYDIIHLRNQSIKIEQDEPKEEIQL